MRCDIAIKVDETSKPGSITVTKTADGTITIKSHGLSVAAVNGTTTLPPEVTAMIDRHEANGHPGTRSRELTETLVANGWTAKAGPKYLRFIYTGSERKVTLYANSRDIMTREIREIALALPEAIGSKNEVRWRYDGNHFADALVAADLLTKWADAVEPEPEDDESA